MSKEFEGNSPEEFEQLTNRIQAADPAAAIDEPTVAHLETLLNRAANEAGGERRFFSPRQRVQWVRSLTTVGVMAAAMALILPSVLGSGNTGNGGYLFSLGSGGSAAAAPESVAAGGMKIAADSQAAMCLGPCGFHPMQFQFSADSSLSDSASSAEIFKLEPTRGPGQTLNAIADAFGVHAATVTQEPNAGDTWYSLYKGWDPSSTEPQTKPMVSVYYDTRNMVPNWNYSVNNMLWTTCEYREAAANGDPVPLVDFTKLDPNENTCTAEISGHAPNTAQALVLAAKYFKAIGYNASPNLAKVGNGDLFLVGPQDNNTSGAAISISAYLKVAGSITAMSMGIGWYGSTNELSYAYGFDGQAVTKGSFGMLSAKAAVDRLSKWQWAGNPYLDWSTIKYSKNMNMPMLYDTATGGGQSTTGTVTPDVSTSSSSGASASGSSGAPVDPGMAVDPLPADAGPVDPSATPQPEPSPIVVDITVTKAQNALMIAYGEDGSVWFVPGYIYFDNSGYVGNVFAIVDGVIKLPEVTTMMVK